MYKQLEKIVQHSHTLTAPDVSVITYTLFNCVQSLCAYEASE